MKIYIVRHAESKRNVRQKSDEDPELTEVGKEQARRLGSYFHKVKLNKIYCSTLKRAKTTLEKIKPYVKKVPVSYTKKVIEHNMGIFGNNGGDDWKGYAKAAKKTKVHFTIFKPKYGESLIEAYKRAGNFYKELLKEHGNKDKILVVSHGIFSLYLVLNILFLDISEGAYYKLSNAGVSTIEIDSKGKITDFHINDYNHLIREGMKKNDIISKKSNRL